MCFRTISDLQEGDRVPSHTSLTFLGNASRRHKTTSKTRVLGLTQRRRLTADLPERRPSPH